MCSATYATAHTLITIRDEAFDRSFERFLRKEMRVVPGNAELLCSDRAEKVTSRRRVSEAVAHGAAVFFGDGEEMRVPLFAVFLPDREHETQLSRALLEENDPVRPCLVLWRLFNAEVDGVVVALDRLQQLHKAVKNAFLVGFGRTRMPDAESESFWINGRVIA